MTRRAPKMRLTRGPSEPVTVAEWDATPGLHAWIEGEIRRREEAARDATEGPWSAEHPEGRWGDDPEARLIGRGKILGTLSNDYNGHLNADHIELHGPDAVLRRCAADRKILAAHPYTERAINPGYGPSRAPFGCETCHDWDGVPEARGNCDTILALAEGYGLEPVDETDVEVIRA